MLLLTSASTSRTPARRMLLFAGLIGACLCASAASANATTVTLGPPNLGTGTLAYNCQVGGLSPCASESFVDEVVPAGEAAAPGPGVITALRVRGTVTGGSIALVVLGGATGTGYTSSAISAPATNLDGTPNSVNIPVQAGDRVGLTLNSGSGSAQVNIVNVTGAQYRFFDPGFTAVSQTMASTTTGSDMPPAFNADLVLAPSVSSLSPTSGPASGGTEVTINGQDLDGATGVRFGGTAASSFVVDSPTQIRAVAPPGAQGSTVDVTVTGPGGTSATSSLTKYSYVASMGMGGAKLTAVGQSHRRWREGSGLPHIASARPPVGTIFRFTLSSSARVRFRFKQRLPGRRVNGRCVAPSAKNRGKPKCTRLVSRGALSFSVKAGAHRLRFQGRISKHKRLPIGRYTVVITATNSAGQQATAKLMFTIVKG